MLITYALKSEVLFQVTQAAYHSWTLCSAILYSYYAILFKFYLQPLLFLHTNAFVRCMFAVGFEK